MTLQRRSLPVRAPSTQLGEACLFPTTEPRTRQPIRILLLSSRSCQDIISCGQSVSSSLPYAASTKRLIGPRQKGKLLSLRNG